MGCRVLVIAAHPDDETYGLGGTIAHHVQEGDQVSVLIMTDGVTARHNHIEPQKAAARKACGTLGVNEVHFAGLPDQRLDGMPLLEVIKPIHELVKGLCPEVVYTHHRGDANQDHRTAFAATMVAVRPTDGCSVRRVLCYEVASSTEWGAPFSECTFVPNVFVDISTTLESKLAALKAYRETFQTEVKAFPHPRSPEAVLIYVQQRGVTVGMQAAEAFVLFRELVKE
jgi:LmbE family N-acetylglucosaminyl deacetylase